MFRRRLGQKLYYFVGGHRLEHVEHSGLALADDWSLRGGGGLWSTFDVN